MRNTDYMSPYEKNYTKINVTSQINEGGNIVQHQGARSSLDVNRSVVSIDDQANAGKK
jgi:hypothetical protein